jgi:hypothetical protein
MPARVPSEETVERLKWHAGFGERPVDAATPSISDCTAPKSSVAESLPLAIADFVDALEALNRELNGDVPSETIEGKADSVPRSVAYSVAEAASMLRDAGQDDWSVNTAWEAVLAGDIDDLHEHLELEGDWRG